MYQQLVTRSWARPFFSDATKLTKAALFAGFATFAVLAVLTTETAVAGSITAELSRTAINIGENAELHVSVEGSLDGDIEIPVVDGLLFDQAGRSNQMSFNNGSFSHTLTLVYIVRAQKTGTFTIPSIKVVIDKANEATLPLTLTVSGQGSSQQGQAGTNSGGGQNNQHGGTASGQAVKQTAGVFLERECDKKDPYVGEQVICYVRIYHRNNIYSGQRQGDVGTDFRRFSIEGERKYVRQVEGKSYGVIELREVIVPLKPGKTVLPPAGLAARIAVPGRRGRTMDRLMDQLRGGLFNMDPFNDEQEALLESNAIDMDVKPLPEKDKPKTFSGVVGNVIMTAQVSSNHVKAGENLTITIEVSGNAVLDTLADPALTFPDIGKVYNDKPEYNEKIDPDRGISSSKTFKIALVPTQAGTFNLGSWELAFFDPESGTWKTLKAPLGTIVVDPSKAEEQLPAGMTADEKGPQSVKLLGQDVIGPHRSVNAEHNDYVSSKDRWLYLLGGGVPLGASLMFVGASLLWGQRSEHDKTARSSRAARAADKTAQDLRKKLRSGDHSVKASEVAMVIKQYFGDKSGRQGSALTSGDMIGLTQKHGAQAQVETCKVLLQTAERWEYGGASDPGNHEALLSWLDDCSGFLRDLDKSWKGRV